MLRLFTNLMEGNFSINKRLTKHVNRLNIAMKVTKPTADEREMQIILTQKYVKE